MDRLDNASNFTGFDARGAYFKPFDSCAYPGFDWLQVGEPTALVVWVPVRTQEGVIVSGHRTLPANITTSGHLFYSFQIPLLVGINFCLDAFLVRRLNNNFCLMPRYGLASPGFRGAWLVRQVCNACRAGLYHGDPGFREFLRLSW